MKHATRVRTPIELGALVREARREAGTDQAEAAGFAGVGVRFLGELERGKPNVRLGLVLQVLERLGLEVWIGPRGASPR
jgi:y4mF family transcriptional regulator